MLSSIEKGLASKPWAAPTLNDAAPREVHFDERAHRFVALEEEEEEEDGDDESELNMVRGMAADDEATRSRRPLRGCFWTCLCCGPCALVFVVCVAIIDVIWSIHHFGHLSSATLEPFAALRFATLTRIWTGRARRRRHGRPRCGAACCKWWAKWHQMGKPRDPFAVIKHNKGVRASDDTEQIDAPTASGFWPQVERATVQTFRSTRLWHFENPNRTDLQRWRSWRSPLAAQPLATLFERGLSNQGDPRRMLAFAQRLLAGTAEPELQSRDAPAAARQAGLRSIQACLDGLRRSHLVLGPSGPSGKFCRFCDSLDGVCV